MNKTRVLGPPGNKSFSIMFFSVPTQTPKYPESIAGFDTSSTKMKVGGMGGLFMYSLEATKSTDPFLNSALSSRSCLNPKEFTGE